MRSYAADRWGVVRRGRVTGERRRGLKGGVAARTADVWQPITRQDHAITSCLDTLNGAGQHFSGYVCVVC